MSDVRRPADAGGHTTRQVLVAATAGVALLVLLGCHAQPATSGLVPPPGAAVADHRHGHGNADVPGELPMVAGGQRAALDVAGGEVPDGVSVLDDRYPAVANLEPRLRGALREAAAAAADDGIRLSVTSGWRSRTYQERLFEGAVARYGSPEEAARWVAPPGTSAHEAGQAVDLGPAAARAWLSEHGARFGLCQVYANEPWHVELRPEAVEHGCPAMYADPTDDPRTHR